MKKNESEVPFNTLISELGWGSKLLDSSMINKFDKELFLQNINSKYLEYIPLKNINTFKDINLKGWTIYDVKEYKTDTPSQYINYSKIETINGIIEGRNGYVMLRTLMEGWFSEFNIMLQIPLDTKIGFIFLSPDTPLKYLHIGEEISKIINELF